MTGGYSYPIQQLLKLPVSKDVSKMSEMLILMPDLKPITMKEKELYMWPLQPHLTFRYEH